MTPKKQTWLIDAEGTYALVDTADVDMWKPLGWAVSDSDPAYTIDQFAWLQHETHGGLQRFPLASVPHWAALGWYPAPPPRPVDLTKDSALVDVPETPAKLAAKPAATKE